MAFVFPRLTCVIFVLNHYFFFPFVVSIHSHWLYHRSHSSRWVQSAHEGVYEK